MHSSRHAVKRAEQCQLFTQLDSKCMPSSERDLGLVGLEFTIRDVNFDVIVVQSGVRPTLSSRARRKFSTDSNAYEHEHERLPYLSYKGLFAVDAPASHTFKAIRFPTFLVLPRIEVM